MHAVPSFQRIFLISLTSAFLLYAAAQCSGSETPADNIRSGATQHAGGISMAPATGVAEPLPPLTQDHCFCLGPRIPTPNDPMPHYLCRMDTVSPECAAMEVKIATTPVEAQFTFCVALVRCWEWRAWYADRKISLARKISAARDDAAGCCAGKGPGPADRPITCDQKCLEVWKRKIQAALDELEGMDRKARAELDICVAGLIPQKRKAEDTRPSKDQRPK